ncbi:hypothetical protein I4U23_011188 [Adineta vaga]|nr:hypothetical protein I4U23_011188 [Adineta vaga]
MEFARLLYLVQSINHGNAIMSTFGSNYQYKFISNNGTLQYTYLPTKAMIYDDNCSCGLQTNCTSQAYFIESHSSNRSEVKGLKIGCTPSESFLLSTLECFYDQSCLSLIQQYTNSTHDMNLTTPLSTIVKSRFLPNTTINKLIEHLFMEEWNTTKDYELYFKQCLPLSCSFTYIEQVNLLHTITVLFGLQGGLAIILKWICPKLIGITMKIYEYRKKRRIHIQSQYSTKSMPIESIQTNMHSFSNNKESIVTISATQ